MSRMADEGTMAIANFSNVCYCCYEK